MKPQGFFQHFMQHPREALPLVMTFAIIIGVRIWIRRRWLSNTPSHTASSKIVVTQVNIYPVKSCKGISLKSCEVGKYGLENDRRWMVITEDNNRFTSQRVLPRMALIDTSIDGNILTLSAPNMKPLKIVMSGKDVHQGKELDVTVWKSQCKGIDEGDEVAAWLNTFLERKDLRLVRLPENNPRKVANAAEGVSFADGYPFLMISEESLEDLNQRMKANPANAEKPELEMRRFRPNIVVKGAGKPFAEDDWKKFKIGDTVLYPVKMCARCKIPTINPDKGEFEPPEPLETLATFRQGLMKGKDELCFGQNLIHEEAGGVIAVGSPVHIIQ